MQIKNILNDSVSLIALVEDFSDLKYDFVYGIEQEVLVSFLAKEKANTAKLVKILDKYYIRLMYIDPILNREVYFPDSLIYIGSSVEDEKIFLEPGLLLSDIHKQLREYKNLSLDVCKSIVVDIKTKLFENLLFINTYINSFGFDPHSLKFNGNEISIYNQSITLDFLNGLQKLLPNREILITPGINSFCVSWNRKIRQTT